MTTLSFDRLQECFFLFKFKDVTNQGFMSSKLRMNQAEEQELVKGILTHNVASIKSFVQAHQDRVYAQAIRMLGNREDAEEASQDTLLKALKQMPKFEGRCKLSTWVYRITYTTCLDVLKKRRRAPKEEDIDEQRETSWSTLEEGLSLLEDKEQKELIDKAIEVLNPEDGLLIELYHMQGQSIAELSEITGLNESAAKVRLFRARKKLALYLEKSLPKETLMNLGHGTR